MQYANLGRVYNALCNGHAACDAFARALYRFRHCGDWQREAAALQLLLDQLASSAKSHGAKSDTTEIQGHLYRYAQLLREHPGQIDTNTDFRRKLSTWHMHLPRLDIPLTQDARQASPRRTTPDSTQAEAVDARSPPTPPTAFRQASASGEEQVQGGGGSSPSSSRRSSLDALAAVDDLPVSDLLEHSFTNIPFADVAAFHDADTQQANAVLDMVAAQARMAKAQQDTTAAAMGSSKLKHLAQPPAQALWHQYMSCASSPAPNEGAAVLAASRLHSWQPQAAQAATAAMCSDSSWLGSALKVAGGGGASSSTLPTSLDTLGLADPGLAGMGQARSARVANEELLHGQSTASSAEDNAVVPEPSSKDSSNGGLFGFSWGGSKDAAAAGSAASKLLKEGSVKSDTRPTLTNSSVQRCVTSMASFSLRAAEEHAVLASSLELAHTHLSDLLRVQAADIPTQLAQASSAADVLRTAETSLNKAQTALDSKSSERTRLQQQYDELTQQLLAAQATVDAETAHPAAPSSTGVLSSLQAARATSVKGRRDTPAATSASAAPAGGAGQPAARKTLLKLQGSAESLGRAVASATGAVDDALVVVQQASEQVAAARQRRLDICRDSAEAVHAAAVRRGKAVEDALQAAASLSTSAARVSSALAAVMSDSVAATSTLSDIACFTHMARVRHLMHLHNAQAASQAEILSSRAGAHEGGDSEQWGGGGDADSEGQEGDSDGADGDGEDGDSPVASGAPASPHPSGTIRTSASKKRSIFQRMRHSSKTLLARRARSAAAAASITRDRLVVPEAQSRSERTAVSSQYAADSAAMTTVVDCWVQALLAGQGSEQYNYTKQLSSVSSEDLAAQLVLPIVGGSNQAPGGFSPDGDTAQTRPTEARSSAASPPTVHAAFTDCMDARLLFSRAAGRALFLKYLNFYRTSGTLERTVSLPVDERQASPYAVRQWLELVHSDSAVDGTDVQGTVQAVDAFHRLGRAMWWLLDAALVHCDLGVARSVMILAETFGCVVDSDAAASSVSDGGHQGGRSGDKVFLQRLVAHHRVWSNAWIWEELFHRSIRHDVHRLLGVGSTGSSAKRGIPQSPGRGKPMSEARDFQVKLLTEWPSTYTNHLFSHLGSFSLNMRLFCVPERMVNSVIARLAANHGLPEQLASALTAQA